MSGIPCATMLEAITAGHDDLYNLAAELGADVEQVRPVVDQLVTIGWLRRWHDVVIDRYEVMERAVAA